MKKPIDKKAFSHEKNAENMLLETHVSMFEYSGLPETVDPYFLEFFLQCEGSVAWTDKMPGCDGLIVTSATTGDDLDPYGIGRKVIMVTRNGHSLTGTRGVDCVYAYNNLSMTPCGDIFTDAQTLADIQTSVDFLIFWTRLSPFLRVSDEKTKIKVEEAFRNMKKGIPVTLASKKILGEFGLSDDISVDMLTQPDFADKIQYTAKLYDDVLRWHMTRYGHATNGNSKAAQQTVDEVDSTASQSMILPLAMLKARREMIDEVNTMFGTDITVELAGAWRAEVTAYENQSGEASIDESADDVADVSVSDLPGDPSGEDQAPDDNNTGEGQEGTAPEETVPEVVINTETVVIKEPEKEESEDPKKGDEDA